MNRPRVISLLLILTATVAATAEAGWSRAGLYSADVRSLIALPSDPDTLFLGTSNGDIYISTDAARSWTSPRGSTPFPGYVVDNLTFDSKGRLWMAAWGLWGQSIIAYSSDHGRSWTRRDAGISESSIRALAIDPTNASVLYAGGLDGVWKSINDGRTWFRTVDLVNVESLAIDPSRPATVYAGTWRQGWRTDDGGKNWKLIATGMVLDTDIFGINIDPANPDDLWVSTCGWVYNSRNRGDLWTRYREGFENRRIHVIERDAENEACLYAASVAGLYRTLDRGESWERITDDTLVINSIVIHPKRPARIVLGTEGDGVYVSEDRGKTWTRRSNGLHNVRVGDIVADDRDPDHIFSVVNFSGSSSGIYVSSDRGKTWQRRSRTRLPEVLSLSIRRGEKPAFVAGTEQGIYLSDDGVEWTRAVPTDFPFRTNKILRWNSSRLFAATSIGVLTTSDGGNQWRRLGDSFENVQSIAIDKRGNDVSLLALSSEGLRRFADDGWHDVEGAPGGRNLELTSLSGKRVALISESRSIAVGTYELDRWRSMSLKIPEGSTVHSAAPGELRFFTSDPQRHLAMARAGEALKKTGAPVEAREITAISFDPADRSRLYVATSGSGIIVLDERADEAPELVQTASGTK